MRLVVGVQLAPEDVEAIKQGLSEREVIERALDRESPKPEDFTQRRMQALAWMVANGFLEIKVAMPVENGKPVPRAIFHHKTGIFTDASGDKISFTGSVNESEQGWTLNNESFHVFCSWKEKDHLDDDVERFEKHWNNSSTKARVYEFPEALKRKIISFAPREPPTVEQEERVEPVTPSDFRKVIVRDFILGARYLFNGEYLADAFLNFELRPHQRAVADAVSKSFPARFLLADEVGLGKTMEAGTILSRLIISGKVRRSTETEKP